MQFCRKFVYKKDEENVIKYKISQDVTNFGKKLKNEMIFKALFYFESN